MNHRTILLTALASASLATAAAAARLPRNAWVPDALSVHVTDPGWEFVSSEFEEWMNTELEPMVMALAPIEVYDEGCFWLYNAFITEITQVQYGYPQLSIDSRNGFLHVDLVIDNFDMRFVLEGDGAFCLDHYDCNSRITANRLEAHGRVYLNVIGNEVHSSVAGVWARINGYEYDTEFWCFIIETIAEILESTIEENLEALLTESINTQLPSMIDDLFSELNFEATMNLFGKSATMEAQPEATDIDGEGSAIRLTARTLTTPDGCAPIEDSFRHTVGGPISYGPTVPDLGGPYDAAVSVSDDALNGALYAAYDAGALCIVLDENAEEIYGIPWNFTTTDLWIFFPELARLYPDAPVRLDIIPQTAPFVSVGTGDFIVEGQLVAEIPSAYIDLYVWDADLGDWVLALRVDTFYRAELLVHISPKGNLKIYVAGFPDITMEILEEPIVDFNDLVVERLVPFVLRVATPLLVASLDNFPLPTFMGYGIEPLAVVADGPDQNHLSIYGNLFEEAALESAARPIDPSCFDAPPVWNRTLRRDSK